MLTVFCSSMSSHLLKLYWSTLCASLCSFVLIYYYVLCIIMYYYVCVSSYELLVHPYVYMCPHMFFIDGIYLVFICYLFCSYVLFVYISVICMCISHMQECGLYVSLTKHTILVKILNLQDTGVFWLFTCLSVCVFCVLCVFWFHTISFLHLLCTKSVVWPRVLCKHLGGG